MQAVRYRDAGSSDREALWRFLAIAAYEPDVAAAQRVPVVAAHLEGWPRPGDFGVIAELHGEPVGAAWARQFDPSEHPVFYVGPSIPEVSIGVLPRARGAGVGAVLLQRLSAQARRRGLPGLCLNVRDSNPARRLYERAGYRLVEGAATPNRVGGLSLGMVMDLA